MNLLLRLTGNGEALASKLLERARMQWQADLAHVIEVYQHCEWGRGGG